MRKSNSNLAKTLGIGAIAAAAAFMPMKAEGDVIDYETQTTISAIDDNSDGITDRYRFDWQVLNISEGELVGTAIDNFGIKDTKLSERGISAPTTAYGDQWNYSENTTDSVLTMPESMDTPIVKLGENIFTSYINASDTIGFEQRDTYVTTLGSPGVKYSNDEFNELILSLDDAIGTHTGFFTSQIPEPMTIGLLASGALVTLLGRRIKKDHRY